jgi:hypothetical protein
MIKNIRITNFEKFYESQTIAFETINGLEELRNFSKMA